MPYANILVKLRKKKKKKNKKERKYIMPDVGAFANIVDPDQTPQIDQGLLCLH